MPIYEFRCHKCGHRFEKLCSMGESGANIQCPACSAPAPQRVMSGFCKKGSGDPVTGGGGGGGCSTCSSSNCSSCGH
ncbi:FmdB family zinc ribbon protein [Desulfallas thermosapovorans]|uniref:FmdB family zinc ribbon protein n=1 Tax=Desulfallas thermosapovorans TaxID=58137 RepID=UPI001411F154|nr:zinc ribbon domain-containing protein [Desulfallas thermosapovorans]